MADAGKVAILPRGLWSEETVYEPLDLVYYENNSYVALKESVGVTPVDGGTWMLSLSGISQETIEAILNGTQQVGDSAKLGGKDASKYSLVSGTYLATSILDYALTLGEGEYLVRLSGSSYSGNDLPDSNYAFGSAKIYKRGAGAITVSLLGAYSSTLRRMTSNYFNGSQWSGWNDEVITSDLANYLPLGGGKISANSTVPLELKSTNSTDTVLMNLLNKEDTQLMAIGMRLGKPVMRVMGGAWDEILYTGNKPTGTYTGNGDATQRNVEIGGFGEMLYVTPKGSTWLFAIVTRRGYIAAIDENTLVRGTDAYLNSDYSLRLMTTSSVLNANGQIYEYQRL